jgi:uncharacterized protein
VRVHTINPGFVETEGFPQKTVLRSPLFRRLVIGPDVVARRVMATIEHDRREVFVPRWYRAFAIAQALVPGVFARVTSRNAYR